ncbi:MAG: ATP-dependent DNA helicase, partial [Bacteroidetes bacterium]
EKGLDDKTYKPNVVLNRISSAKNRLISWRSYLQNPVFQADDNSQMKPEMGNLYKAYSERCFKADAMDFDDLLFNTNLLFKDFPEVLHKYQHRFHFVMVDEFQDTNLSQYLITKKLAAVRQNIAVVGDDAQSIYAFRGADIQNILNFEKDYPDLRVIKLEQNYRSTQNIVNVANSVINHNKAQLHKNVWTQNEDGELIHLMKATSDNEEGKLVASSIFEEKVNHQYKNSDFAILYRTNSQSRAMEEALRRVNIGYKVVGGLSFYQRKEIKDLMGYFRFVVNQNDEQALRRIINLPKRGIGLSSIEKLMVAAYDHDISLWEVLVNVKSFLSPRAANAVHDFVTTIRSFKIVAEQKDAFATANHIAKGSGLLKFLYEDKTIEGLNRYENVQELLNAIKEFVDSPEDSRKDNSLGAFLQEIALLTDTDTEKDNELEKVTLMTIHSAKGLEFKNVYVVGLEEDLFPSQMMLSSRADLEEERRLFYVSITRTQKKLFLSYALTRYRYGRLKSCEPSRFIEEIDPVFIKVDRKWSSGKFSGTTPLNTVSNNYAKSLVTGIQRQNLRPLNGNTQITTSKSFTPSDTSMLQEGMKVEHPKFGYGMVIKLDQEGGQKKARVNFENFGEKTLLLSFAKLKIHDSQ